MHGVLDVMQGTADGAERMTGMAKLGAAPFDGISYGHWANLLERDPEKCGG
jgi:hypothetical protein